MVKVYFSRFDAPFTPATITMLSQQLPPSLWEKTLRFRRWQDRQATVLGKWMLQHALQQEGYPGLSDDSITYTRYNRPMLPPPLDFNISHSASFVVCAISDNATVGIDIEAIRPIEIGDFQQLFNAAEWNDILHAPEQLQRFYHYWALKESVIKADGRGLSAPMKEMIIDGIAATLQDRKWFLQELMIDDGYKCFIATSVRQETTLIPFPI